MKYVLAPGSRRNTAPLEKFATTGEGLRVAFFGCLWKDEIRLLHFSMKAVGMLNITMPVFNRYETTQLSLLALRKCSRTVPFTVTVVDNGSEPRLVEKLREFKAAGVIDKLFLLEKNMGISCAANIGWEMTDAPFYMKLDNDIVIKDTDFFVKIFRLWSYGEPLSTLSGASRQETLRNPGALRTPDGILGVCANTLPGHAIFIPKKVSDTLGLWSEDYGFYGAEDGDYGLRMHRAGLRQYYYCQEGFLTNLGDDDVSTYKARNLDKQAEQRAALYGADGEYGLFMINQCLYNLCIRTWKPVRKYKVVDISADDNVRLEENEEYPGYKALLDRCAEKINRRVRELKPVNPDAVFTADFIQELKDTMTAGGYGFETFAQEL